VTKSVSVETDTEMVPDGFTSGLPRNPELAEGVLPDVAPPAPKDFRYFRKLDHFSIHSLLWSGELSWRKEKGCEVRGFTRRI
jgi:hypothetical protein